MKGLIIAIQFLTRLPTPRVAVSSWFEKPK